MSNAVYPKFKQALLSAATPPADIYLSANVRMVLIDEGTYTYDAAHEFLSDIPSGARIAISGLLTSKAISATGQVQSANARFDGVTGVSVEAFAMFFDSGTPATSRLVFFQDTDVTGLPATPDGASYNLLVDPTGWFTL